MKHILCTLLVFLTSTSLFGQNQEFSYFTPAQIQTIKASVEKKALIFLKELESTSYQSPGSQEYLLDTFKAQETARMTMDLAESNAAMNEVTNNLYQDYDKILNKYYNRLKTLLSPEDQKTLIQAQRAWLTYQTAERELIITLMSENYSGGGAITSNISTYLICDLLFKRTHEIGDYYQMVADTKANGE